MSPPVTLRTNVRSLALCTKTNAARSVCGPARAKVQSWNCISVNCLPRPLRPLLPVLLVVEDKTQKGTGQVEERRTAIYMLPKNEESHGHPYFPVYFLFYFLSL